MVSLGPRGAKTQAMNEKLSLGQITMTTPSAGRLEIAAKRCLLVISQEYQMHGLYMYPFISTVS